MFYFLGIVEDAIDSMGSLVFGFLRYISFFIVDIIYPFIIYLYNIFLLLIRGRLLSNDIIHDLSSRVGLLLGIVMFFILIINIIQMLVDPDKINNKEKGAGTIIVRVLTVIVMFGVSNFAFDTLYYVQDVIVDSNVIGRFFIPSDVDTDDFGAHLSLELFRAFYTLNPDAEEYEKELASIGQGCGKMLYGTGDGSLRDSVYEKYDFGVAEKCLGEKETYSGMWWWAKKRYVIDFNWFLAVLGGIVSIYFLVSYCITAGVRMIQLAVLEILSPMAFVSYLSPSKKNMFDSWLKMYTSTFLDSFIRIAIINFAVYLVALILAGSSSDSKFFTDVLGNEMVNNNYWVQSFIEIVMIFAIFNFAKKAPELLKSLFPNSGISSGLGFGASGLGKFLGGLGIGAAGLGIGAAIGGAGSAIRGATRGVIGAQPGFLNKLRGGLGGGLTGLGGGLLSGGLAGAKSKKIGAAFGASHKAAIDQGRRVAAWKNAGGGNILTRGLAGVNQFMGLPGKVEQLDFEKSNIEAENSVYSQFSTHFKDAKDRAESQILKGKFSGNENADKALTAHRTMEALQQRAGNLKQSDYTKLVDTGKVDEKGNKIMESIFDEEAYKSAQQEIFKQMDEVQANYHEYMKQATIDYFKSGEDGQVNNSIAQAQALIDNNSDYAGFTGVSVSDFKSFDDANTKVTNQVSKNTVALSQNANRGKRARADANYHGGSK